MMRIACLYLNDRKQYMEACVVIKMKNHLKYV